MLILESASLASATLKFIFVDIVD